MVGYPFVLPDMIGGNGYNNIRPDEEIFVRWLQANVFMPSLQFSYVPWDYSDGSVDVSKKNLINFLQFSNLIDSN
jgi:alpha-glucosidase (family GH31 glycosyl hydrolase)